MGDETELEIEAEIELEIEAEIEAEIELELECGLYMEYKIASDSGRSDCSSTVTSVDRCAKREAQMTLMSSALALEA